MKCGLCDEVASFHIQVDKNSRHLCRRHMEEYSRSGNRYEILWVKASELIKDYPTKFRDFLLVLKKGGRI